MSEVDAVNANSAVNEENSQNARGKQKKSPRVSTIDRTREESEAITKGLGPEVEGRRRTRSAVKGVTATPPPPAKKEKKQHSNAATGKPKGRGRPKKNVEESSDSHDESKDAPATEVGDDKKSEDKEDVTENSHKDETGNNNAETPKESSEETTENGAKEDSTDTQTSEPKSEDEKKTEENSDPAIEGDKSAE